MGAEMGFDVWVAKNDRARLYNGAKFSEMPRMLSSLPVQFDDATNRTVELIDVLWLQEHAIQHRMKHDITRDYWMADLLHATEHQHPALFGRPRRAPR